MSTPKKIAAVLRRAAANLDAQKPHRRYQSPSDYPCWYVAEADGGYANDWIDSEAGAAFLSVFSARLTQEARSDEYLDEFNFRNYVERREALVLSLLFAADIIEAGDAP